jgi:hypothetical protein
MTTTNANGIRRQIKNGPQQRVEGVQRRLTKINNHYEPLTTTTNANNTGYHGKLQQLTHRLMKRLTSSRRGQPVTIVGGEII